MVNQGPFRATRPELEDDHADAPAAGFRVAIDHVNEV